MDRNVLGIFTFFLLCISILANVLFFKNYLQQDNGVDSVKEEQQILLEQYKIQQRDYDRLKESFRAIREPGTRSVLLNGAENHVNSEAIAYYNENSKAIHIDANKLPSPPGGKQYQAWALSKGVYLSLGVFNHQPDKDNLFQLKTLRNIEPEAVFISLEKTQGNKQPTLEEVYVKGNLNNYELEIKN